MFVWESIAFYCVKAVFTVYQHQQLRALQGWPSPHKNVLLASAALSMLGGLAYLAYYGWTISWAGAAAVFGMGLAACMVASLVIGRTISVQAMSLAGFVGWPVCLFLAFKAIVR